MNHHKIEFDIKVMDITYWDKVMSWLKYESFEVEFWHSFVPPNHFVVKLGPFTDQGLANTKEQFLSLGIKPEHFTFRVT